MSEWEEIQLGIRQGRNSPCSGYRFGGNRYGIYIFRLDQKTTCTSKTLAEVNSYPLIENRLYKMRFDVVGKQIRAYIDDELLMTAEDDIYPRGGVSLSAYEVKWAYFDNIRVFSLLPTETPAPSPIIKVSTPTLVEILQRGKMIFEDNFDDNRNGWRVCSGPKKLDKKTG